MKPLAFKSQISALRSRLQHELPGITAHLKMAPGLRSKPELLSISDKPCRTAGVLALLYPLHDSTPGILLTKRREDLPEHAGQISFPGGRQEPEETLVQTALRETKEEIGLSPSGIEVIGSLSPIYIDVSNYCVHPFVGVMHEPAAAFKLQQEEVQKVLQLPISDLASPSNHRSETREIRGLTMDIPFYFVNQEVVWGATAMILAELLMIMSEGNSIFNQSVR